ncbi:MAG: DUF899 domain-containing protein [Gammaproteobacteria bacterium]|nr:DUF899 domain-containing protein [Gammaproteobacteria bacterium]
MNKPVVDRDTWLKQRMALLRREKAASPDWDFLAEERQKLPWVQLEKDYNLITTEDTVFLLPFAGN